MNISEGRRIVPENQFNKPQILHLLKHIHLHDQILFKFQMLNQILLDA